MKIKFISLYGLWKIYNKIPVEILNIISIGYHILPTSIKYGKIFRKKYKELQEDIDTEEKRIEIEYKYLLETINNASINVPYYQEMFQKHGICIDEIKTIKDIEKIPLLSKEDIRMNIDKLISIKCDKSKLMHVSTSGTTGNPLEFFQDKDILMQEWAYVNYVWGRVGYKPDSSRLVLRGKVFRNQKIKGQNWQWDAVKRELSCNIFDMTDENMELYCKQIEKYKPEFIHGYMSAVVNLCKYIENRGLAHQFKAILATSENILESQIVYVETVLNARVFSFYGHSERLLLAAECEYSKEYHIEPTYGYAEIIDAEGQVISEPGIKGELVVTGFMNKSMPLIRYRTNDIAEWSEIKKCSCGRVHRRIKRISGRWNQDILIKENGVSVTLTALNMHSEVFANVVKYQFYQEELGRAILRIVPTSKYSDEDTSKIKKSIYEKIGGGLEIEILLQKEIRLNKNGKYTMVIQKIDIVHINNLYSISEEK